MDKSTFLLARISANKCIFAIISVIQFLCGSSNLMKAQGNYNYVKTETLLDSHGTNMTTSIQYYDDWGRPTLSASNGIGGSNKYVYSLQRYDRLDRVAKSWIPVVGTTSLSYKTENEISSSAASTYSDGRAFVTYSYDELDRVLSEGIPGGAWANKANTNYYSTNHSQEVKKYSVNINSGELEESGYYSKSTLKAVTSADADGISMTVYEDLSGRKILERRDSDNDTYFVYDYKGQLRYVLSPMYQEEADIDKFAYVYRYDGLGNVNYKKIPGCQPITYKYDKGGRLIFEQDGVLRQEYRTRFYVYDNHNRIVIQGTCSAPSGDVISLPKATRNHTYGGFKNTGYDVTHSYNFSNAQLEIVNYYDDYSFISTHSSEFPACLTSGHSSADKAYGQLVATKKLTSNGEFLYSVFDYDSHGNVIEARELGLSGRLTTTTTSYSFTDLPLTSTTTVGESNPIVTATEVFTYNNANNKVASVQTTVKSGALQRTSQQQFSYDNLGRLSTITRPSAIGNVSYIYNIQGWLTNINANNYGEQIHYYDGYSQPCYNGNISSIVIRHPSEHPETGPFFRGYRYTYDRLNRLINAEYGEGSYLQKNHNRFDEHVTYDANSNITSLVRKGLKQDETYGDIDVLACSYDGNQLSSITESADPVLYSGTVDYKQSGTYAYNENGSVTEDSERGITHIEYDTWGNPRFIQFSNGSETSYVYSASGQKLRTTHKTATNNVILTPGGTSPLASRLIMMIDSVDYIAGGKLTFQNGLFDKFLFDGGYIQKKKVGLLSLQRDTISTYYYNKDHLGNICEVIDEAGNVKQITTYYPFGLPCWNDNVTTGNALQPYKYNGKEFERTHGLNWYDYGARQYDATLCRWNTVDPLCEKYYNVTPYVYCLNNPIRLIDPDGREVAQPDGGKGFKQVGICAMIGGTLMIVGGAAYSVVTEGGGFVAGGGQLMSAGYATIKAGLATYSAGVAIDACKNISEANLKLSSSTTSSCSQSKSLPTTNSKNRKVEPNQGNASQHGGPNHDSEIKKMINKLKKIKGNHNFRKNQRQVDADGNNVGKNRPDIQYDDANGVHHNIEIDNNPTQSLRHQRTINTNDPNSVNEFIILK